MIKFNSKNEFFTIIRNNKELMSCKKDDVFLCAEVIQGNPSISVLNVYNTSNGKLVRFNINETEFSNIKSISYYLCKIMYNSFNIDLINNDTIHEQTIYIGVFTKNLIIVGKKNSFSLIESTNDASIISNDICNFKKNVINIDVALLRDKIFQYDTVYSTNNFAIYDKDDMSKSVVFDLSDIEPNTTRIMTPPSNDGKILTEQNFNENGIYFPSTLNVSSYKLNGIDDTLNIDTDVISNITKAETPFTINLWVNCEDIRNNSEILSIGDYVNGGDILRLYYRQNREGMLHFRYHNSVMSKSNIRSIIDNEWIMITLTSDLIKNKLYINGALMVMKDVSFNNNNNNEMSNVKFNIGAHYKNNKFTKMLLNEMSIYNIEMVQNDINRMWNAGIYITPESNDTFNNCVVNIDSMAEQMKENQPNGVNIVNKVDHTKIGTFVGLHVDTILNSYINDYPNK